MSMTSISLRGADIGTSIPSSRKPLRLLAFDGGIGGLSSLLILRKLMETVAVVKGISDHDRGSLRPSEFFDLIIGTGWGGISALFLGRLEMTVDEAIVAYQEVANAASQPRTLVSRVLHRSSSSRNFEQCVGDIIQRHLGGRDAPLHNLSIQSSHIPCYTAVLSGTTLDADAPPYIFRSYRPSPFTILEVARLATAMTETLSYTLGDPPWKFINACVVGYGNPSKIAMQEASSIWPVFDSRVDCLVSLGTGIQNLVQIGRKWKQVIKGAEQLSQNCEAIHHAVDLELDLYFRFNVPRHLGPRDIRKWMLTESTTSNSIASITEGYIRDRKVVYVMNSCVEMLIAGGSDPRHAIIGYLEPSPADKDQREKRRLDIPHRVRKSSLDHNPNDDDFDPPRNASNNNSNPWPADKPSPIKRRSHGSATDDEFDPRRNISSNSAKPSPVDSPLRIKRSYESALDKEFDTPRSISSEDPNPSLADEQPPIDRRSDMSHGPAGDEFDRRHNSSNNSTSSLGGNQSHMYQGYDLSYILTPYPIDHNSRGTTGNSVHSRAGHLAADVQANYGSTPQNQGDIQQTPAPERAMVDLTRVQLLPSEDQLMDAMVALRNPSSSSGASRKLIHLAKFDDVRPAFVSKGVIPEVTTLLSNPNSTICVSAMHVLEALAEHGDFRNILRNDTVPKVVTLFSDQMVEMEVQQAALSLLKCLSHYDDIYDMYKLDIIPKVVALLGSTSGTIHEQAINILSDIIDESIALSEEIVLQMVKSLNNPSEDISYTTTLLLCALAQKYDNNLASLIRPGLIRELISYIGNNFIHVQCCAMKTMAFFVEEEGIRTTLVDYNVFPTIASLLVNTTISPRMLHVLLWSLDQFLQHDELRSLILRSDTIYALVQLQSSEKLPEDSQRLLSDLIVDENLSLSFAPPPDDSSRSPFISFQCLVGAQEAVDRVLSEADALKALLASHQISPQDYFVQAGYNEDLLASGTGHLEEIYIYLTNEDELPNLSDIIDGVGRLFHPFPCVVMTAEDSYRTLPPPELPLGFDSVILERGDRQRQVIRMTDHMDELGSSELKSNGDSAPHDKEDGGGGSPRQNGSSVGEGGSGSGSGSGNGSSGQDKETSPNKRSEGSGGGDDGGSGSPPNDGDDDEPEGKGVASNGFQEQKVTGTPEVACTSDIEVYLPDSSNLLQGSPPKQVKLFQKFSMRVVVAIDVQPSSDPDPPSVSLQINKLGFYTNPIASEHPYKHHKVEVKIDSSDKKLYPRSWHPESTDAAGNTITHINGRQLTGTLGLTAGTNGVTGNGTISGMISHTRETTRNLSRITALPGDTSVTWSYNVDDSYQQERGLALEQERHPFLKFWLRKAQVDEPLRVEVSGYWVTRITPKKSVKFLAFKKPQAVPLLRNFCHLTCITFPSHLPRSAVSTLRLKAHLPLPPKMCMVIEDPKEEDFELDIKMTGQVELN